MTVAAWDHEVSDGFWRSIAVVSIIVVLETLVIPILSKIQKDVIQRKETLLLERLEDNTFVDTAGTKYEVIKIDEGKL